MINITHLDGVSPYDFLYGGEQAGFVLLHFAWTSGRGWLHLTVLPLGLGWVASTSRDRLLRSFTHSQPHGAPASHRKTCRERENTGVKPGFDVDRFRQATGLLLAGHESREGQAV